MTFLGIVYAIITVLAWGTWLAPSQNVPLPGQQTRTFYVTLAVLAMALVATLFVGFEGLDTSTFLSCFAGGVIWSLSGWSAFIGANQLGMARAFGIWAPMNIGVSIIWGVTLFGEFRETEMSSLLIAILAFLVIVGGILLIIFSGSGDEDNKKVGARGLLGAIGAGVGFASYFIPIQIGTANHPDFNMWIGTFPLAVGMFSGSSLLMIVTRSSPKLEQSGHYLRIMSTGILWGIGNYGALAMMEIIGTGKGFTIAQLCVVVNALVGVYIMKEPAPKTRAARLTLAGVVIATIGGIILGNIK